MLVGVILMASVAGHREQLLLSAPQLQLSCGGCSKEHPLQGNEATAIVTLDQGGVQGVEWVRLDRIDAAASDNTIWREYFPRWAPAKGGSFEISWLQGSKVAGHSQNQLTVVASGWSARHNSTRLTGNSTSATVWYSFDYRSATSTLEAEDAGPGAVRLIGKLGSSVISRWGRHWADTCTFNAYELDTSGKFKPPQLNFKAQFGIHETSPGDRCAINLTFTSPGIWYYGIQAQRTGLTQESPSACTIPPYTNPCDHPLALVIPYINGSKSALPAGFAGRVHAVQPLRTAHQFCVIEPQVTAFAGSQLKIPLCPVVGVSVPPQPRFATVMAPEWLGVHGKTNQTAPTYTAGTVNRTMQVQYKCKCFAVMKMQTNYMRNYP